MLSNVLKPRSLPSLYTSHSSKAKRGSIISSDGFHLAFSEKLYKAVVNTKYIDPQKKELFIKLFSIYSKIPVSDIEKKLSRKGVVVLSYNIAPIQAQYLKKLAYELRRYKVFIELKSAKTGLKSMQGLSILESGETRVYPYGDLLTPIIGYPHKIEDNGYTHIRGVKGLEKKFENMLEAKQDAISRGSRDVNSYIILNNNSFTKAKLDGSDIQLTIPVSLQIKIEKMLDNMKKSLEARQIMIAIMESKTGKIVTLASSNRFLPKSIKRSDYPSLSNGVIEYSFEPGSVIKPITFSLLLDKNLINPYQIVNGHNGRFKVGNTIITDEHKFHFISAENVIVHSSNVGIAILASKLDGNDFYHGLLDYGFSKESMVDLIYQKNGKIPNSTQLDNEVYKSRCAYGYGMNANLMQLMKAYSAFSNNGRTVTPKLIDNFVDEFNREIKIEPEEQIQVIKSSTALKIKKILIKTVNKGTGKKAITKGLVIGGKTGTAHIVKKGQYIKQYNTSFLGFVEDKNNNYTIGVIVVRPQKNHFASQTAVPVFKKAVDIMVEDQFLIPSSDL